MQASFCLARHLALQQIQAALPDDAFIAAYLDDIYTVCNHGDVNAILLTARDILARVCHIGKLAAWCRSICEPPEGFVNLFGQNAWKANKPEHLRGIKILRSPFGSQEHLDQFFAQCLDKEAQRSSNKEAQQSSNQEAQRWDNMAQQSLEKMAQQSSDREAQQSSDKAKQSLDKIAQQSWDKMHGATQVGW